MVHEESCPKALANKLVYSLSWAVVGVKPKRTGTMPVVFSDPPMRHSTVAESVLKPSPTTKVRSAVAYSRAWRRGEDDESTDRRTGASSVTVPWAVACAAAAT